MMRGHEVRSYINPVSDFHSQISVSYLVFKKWAVFFNKIVRILIEMSRVPCLASSVSLIFRRFNWTAWSPQTHDWSRTFPLYQAIKIGCAVFATIFIRFEANFIEYGSYSHVSVYLQTPVIHIISFIFASKYAQNSNTNIRFVAKQIHVLILRNICFKIFVLKWIFAKL
jgi:hypothetical protein